MMNKNQITGKILILIIAGAVMLILTSFITSCRPELSFSDLVICEEVDTVTFVPVEVKDSFDIGVQKIYAVIEVAGARSQDVWKFIWINEDTGEIIAESTNRFSEDSRGYIEGYLSNRLTPGSEENIIGEPGNYRVDFYHNEQLISSADFAIESPVMEITGVILSSGIDKEDQPVNEIDNFYPDDAVYTLIGLNCQISGETISVKWYKGADELLGEKEFNIDKNYYLPGYVKFMITNDGPWPVGDYRIEVYKNEVLEGNYYFKVIKKDIADATFNNNIYENRDYKFSILYPDNWDCEDEVDAKGLNVNFTPSFNDIKTFIKIMVLKKGYYPSKEKYSQFSDSVLKEVIDLGDNMEVESEEKTIEINGITCRQINYSYMAEDKSGRDVDLIYINRNNMLYLFIKFSDIYYKDFSNRLYDKMLDSLSFN